MFFFLSLREPSQRPGTIEPDIPFSSSSSSTHNLIPSTSITNNKSPHTPSSPYQNSTIREYLNLYALYETSDWPALLRRVVCFLAVLFHIPMNVISIVSHGAGIMLFVWILLSLLNLACVILALWKIDVMRGTRLLYSKVLTRKNFDYAILALFLIYGFSFGMFVFVKLRVQTWRLFMNIAWPCLIVTDIFCFLTGWVAVWRDVSVPVLG